MHSRILVRVLAFLALVLLVIAGWWMLRANEAVPTPPPSPDPVANTRGPDLPPPLPDPLTTEDVEETPTPKIVVEADAATGIVSGTVAYVGKQDRAPGVLVQVTRGEDGDTLGEATTDDNGRFLVKGVPPGIWQFRTRTPGDTVDDLEHAVVEVREGRETVMRLFVAYVVPEGEGIGVSISARYEDGRRPETFSLAVHGLERVLRIHGKEGHAKTRFPGGGEYQLDEVFADGVLHDYVQLMQTVVEGDEIAIELQIPRKRTLVVQDRATGAVLPGARVFRRPPEQLGGWSQHYPGPWVEKVKPLLTDGAGRVSLGMTLGGESVFVIAEGHAWKFVEIPAEADSEAIVRLHAGGDVRIIIPRWKELSEANLYTMAEDDWEKWVLPDPKNGTEVRVKGLPTGKRQFVVHRGQWFEDGEVYGSATAEVLAGAEITVTLEARPPDVRNLVIFSGSVTVPTEWKREKTRIHLEGAGPENEGVERSEFLTLTSDGTPVPFSLKPLPPGRYAVTIEPQVYSIVTVPEGGGEHHFVVPPPVEVRVRVIDKATGKDVEATDVSWFMTGEERNSWTHARTTRDAKTKEFIFHAPPGEAVLHMNSGGWIHDPEAEKAGSFWGTNITIPERGPFRVTFRLIRAATVRVVLKGDAGAVVGEDIEVSIGEVSENGGTTHHAYFENGVAERDDLKPGRYTVVMDLPEDIFEPVPEQKIDAVSGQVTEVVIELRKK